VQKLTLLKLCKHLGKRTIFQISIYFLPFASSLFPISYSLSKSKSFCRKINKYLFAKEVAKWRDKRTAEENLLSPRFQRSCSNVPTFKKFAHEKWKYKSYKLCQGRRRAINAKEIPSFFIIEFVSVLSAGNSALKIVIKLLQF